MNCKTIAPEVSGGETEHDYLKRSIAALALTCKHPRKGRCVVGAANAKWYNR